MTAILVLGFLIGMRHALEADHVAVVATLVTRSHSIPQAIRQGAAWGFGHMLTMLLFGSVVLFLDTVIPETLAQSLELAVGVMLLLLGGDVIRQMIVRRIHFHRHQHTDGTAHFHAHGHNKEPHHAPLAHHHVHHKEFPFRALAVGLMHGMAGSAFLILLTLQNVESPATGVLYILLFGLGSLVGMATLSLTMGGIFHFAARWATLFQNGIQATVGSLTMLLGAVMVYQIGFVDGLLIG
jgi:sulfite exporter TauE/SafE